MKKEKVVGQELIEQEIIHKTRHIVDCRAYIKSYQETIQNYQGKIEKDLVEIEQLKNTLTKIG